MKKKKLLLAILAGFLILSLCGCAERTWEDLTYQSSETGKELKVLVIQDFVNTTKFNKTYDDGMHFMSWFGIFLNLDDTELKVKNYKASIKGAAFSHEAIIEPYEYVVLALGSGMEAEPSAGDLQTAYENELKGIAKECPNAIVICAYDFYSKEYETAIESAIANANLSQKVIALDFADYDKHINRGDLPAVHEWMGEYIRRAIAGEESLKNANLDPNKPVIALTFDDGPNTTTTAQVLDVLEEYDIKASFFLIGNNISTSSAKSAKRAVALGCEINSHSTAHAYMNQMTAEEIKDDMGECSDKIYNACGVYPSFFRPPFIAVNDTMHANIKLPFICGYGCNDWDKSVSTQERVKGVLASAKDGAIILLHDAAGNNQTVEALPEIIESLQEQGYQFVTLTQLFAIKGVVPGGDIVYNNALD